VGELVCGAVPGGGVALGERVAGRRVGGSVTASMRKSSVASAQAASPAAVGDCDVTAWLSRSAWRSRSARNRSAFDSKLEYTAPLVNPAAKAIWSRDEAR